MHDFKACHNFHSGHLCNVCSWHWHMCSHMTLITVCHTFHILREIPCCFYFQTVSWFFLEGKNKTANVQMNSTMNRAESVKISCWKVPLIYFSIIDGISQWRSVILSLSITGVKFINYSSRMALNCYFFRG